MGTPGRPSSTRLAELHGIIEDQRRLIADLEGRLSVRALRASRVAGNAARSTDLATWEPACMDPEEWADWQGFNHAAGLPMRAQRPCDDCPMGFALEMFAARRCNGIPGIED